MNRAVPAARPQQKYVPAFTVTKLEGTYRKKVAKMIPIGNKKDKNGNLKTRIEYDEIELPKGYLITFPKSAGDRNSMVPNSVHLDSIEKLQEFGFDATEVPLVDGDGEVVGSVPNVVRKVKDKSAELTNA